MNRIPIVFGLASLLCSVQGQTRYRVVEISITDKDRHRTIAKKINDVGQIAGYQYYSPRDGQGTFWAFRWTPPSKVKLLSSLERMTATSINRSGEIVGDCSVSGSARGFRWDPTVGIQVLQPPLGFRSSWARSINASGTVVGRAYFDDGSDYYSRAVAWESNGVPRELALPPDENWSGAHDINDLGEICGNTYWNAALWSANGEFLSLELIEDAFAAAAYAINNKSDIVGVAAMNSYPDERAFIWTRDRGIENLGILPNRNRSRAFDINDDGVVVGECEQYSSLGYSRAFVWTREHGMLDLTDQIEAQGSGWTLSIASGINNRGEIVGRGIKDRKYRSFLAIPVP